MDKRRPTPRQVALFGILGALTFAAKLVMSPLPNIEPVSLMVMLFAVTFRRKCLYPIYVYVVMEYLVFGFHLWSINYLYVWTVLALIALLLRKQDSPLLWAVVSGGFGLLFGALCAPVYLFPGGPAFALTWWLSGIPFALMHGAGNFLIALLLFQPGRKLLEKLYRPFTTL